MEIERKFLVKSLPASLDYYNKEEIEQGYLCVNPVVRVRRQDENYYLTYKGSGMMSRVEHNLPLTKEGYEHLLQKADGFVITKTRYLIGIEEVLHWDEEHVPITIQRENVGNGMVIELDVFHGEFEGLILAEIEFADEESANSFTMPDCFSEDVTYKEKYHNSYMSQFGNV